MSVDKEDIRKALNQEIPVEWHKSAPTWLRSLLEENERITKEKDYWNDEHSKETERGDRLREELEQLKKHARKIGCRGFCTSQSDDYRGMHQLGEECPACRSTWDNAHQENATRSLRSELVGYRKVLEWYAKKATHQTRRNERGGLSSWYEDDRGDKARSILSQYRGKGDASD